MAQAPLDRLAAARAGVQPGVEQRRQAARAGQNPNEFLSGVNQYGTALSDAQGSGLLGYTVNGQADSRGRYYQDGSMSGAQPVYGVKSFTASPDLWNAENIRSYYQSPGYQNDLGHEQHMSNKGGRFLTNAILGLSKAGVGAGFAGAFAPALFGGGAAGATGVSAGNTAAGLGSGTALSSGAMNLAAQGSLLPSSLFAAGAGGGFLGGLGSNFAKDAALSGAAKGGIGSLLSGGDLGDALKGAALGGLTGGYGDYLGSSLGLGELGSQTFGGALQGASGGIASGDLKGALIGGLIGGGTDYFNAGGNIPGLGTKAGAPLGNGQYGATQGTGILGSLTRGLGTSTGGTSMLGSRKGMLGGALKIGGALYNQGQQGDENEDIRRRLMEAQQAAQGQLGDAQAMYDPYSQAGSQAQSQLMAALQAGFNPQDLENDAGYQFRLKQGQQGLDRQMAASGLGQSGAALKAAQEYGQGLASQEYQDAYNRWLSNNQQLAGQAGMGLNAASGQAGLQQGIAGLTSDLGNIDAQVMAANSQNRQKTLADILSGTGQIFGGF